MQLIPAIDIIDGKCVRLTQGDYTQKKIYNEYPVDVARSFEDAGIKRLHLVDLDGAKAGTVKNWKTLEQISAATRLVVDFGGGIKKEDDLKTIFSSGASFATIGSIAVKDEPLFSSWLGQYGPEKFILGADTLNERIVISGWLESTQWNVFDFIRSYIGKNIEQVFCTDVDRDGLLEGPSIDLYKKIVQRFPSLFFIASGGVSSIADIYSLEKVGCKGVIVGKAIYEGRITLTDLKILAEKFA